MDFQVPLATSLLVFLVMFLASLTRSSLGFGDALVAMPLLVLLTEIYTATPVVALSAIVLEILILWEDRHLIDILSTKKFFVGAPFGIAGGLWLLKSVPESLIKNILGIILVLFGLYNLKQPRLIALKSEKWDYCFGVASGILGGAYNIKGPPIVLMGTLRQWPMKRFRASLQVYSLPLGVLILAGHGIGGLWTWTVLELFLYTLPAIFLGFWLGSKINRNLSPDKYKQYVYVSLVVLGIMLLYRT